MMRKVFSVALMASLACAFGLVQNANAGITVDVLFQDAGAPSGITISPGDAGPGCTFTGYYGNTVASGYCMDVLIKTTDPLIAINTDVTYDSDNGLGVLLAAEPAQTATTSKASKCVPFDGVSDMGTAVGHFDCQVPPPNGPPSVAPGTYKIGTIVWDTSGTTSGIETLTLTRIIVGAVVNGNIVDVSHLVVAGSHIINIIPEPATASLLGLGLVGLILAGRRSRA